MTHQQADYLKIPLLDGAYGVAQIFEIEKTRPGCVFLGLSTRIAKDDAPIAPLHLSEVIGLAFSPDTLIAQRSWVIAGFDQLPRFRQVFDYDAACRADFPDHPTHDPAVIEAFVNALHGLYPWDSFGPLFDQIKRPDLDRPATAKTRGDG